MQRTVTAIIFGTVTMTITLLTAMQMLIFMTMNHTDIEA